MEEKNHNVFDMRNTIVPFALLNVSHAFSELKSGETMEILVGDLDTKKDLFKLLPASHYELIKTKREGSCFHIHLRKIL
jgi:TusA-related sulfurtransferase